jgi:hypothetical protein
MIHGAPQRGPTPRPPAHRRRGEARHLAGRRLGRERGKGALVVGQALDDARVRLARLHKRVPAGAGRKCEAGQRTGRGQLPGRRAGSSAVQAAPRGAGAPASCTGYPVKPGQTRPPVARDLVRQLAREQRRLLHVPAGTELAARRRVRRRLVVCGRGAAGAEGVGLGAWVRPHLLRGMVQTCSQQAPWRLLPRPRPAPPAPRRARHPPSAFWQPARSASTLRRSSPISAKIWGVGGWVGVGWGWGGGRGEEGLGDAGVGRGAPARVCSILPRYALSRLPCARRARA